MNAKSFAELQWPADQYALLDFGDARKLERFGRLVLDRPCPAAESDSVTDRSLWKQADLRLEDSESSTAAANRSHNICEPWPVALERVQFQLRVTPFGHVGLFPEHIAQWNWLLGWTKRLGCEAPAILNLFAYTGGATLLLASHGWQVTHVDASEPTVHWARHNAQLSGLTDAPIRWLVEDARAYVARELKRGRKYEAILLDPPSYGHGPKGKAWHIERDLPQLLAQCIQLLHPHGVIVFTGHSQPEPLNAREFATLRSSFEHPHVECEFSRTTMCDSAGRALDFGWSLRSWCGDSTELASVVP